LPRCCYHLPNAFLDVPRKAKKPVKAEPVRHRPRRLSTTTIRLTLLLGVVLILKLIVVWQLHDHILLQPDAGLDTTAYTSLARRVAAGDLALGPGLYFVSPLYIYFLAVPFALSGSFTCALVLQACLGALAVGLVFFMTREWGGERSAWISAGLFSLTGIVTFYESLVVQAALDPFLTAAALAALTFALTRGHLWWFGLAGLAFGFEVVNRPNALIALAVLTVCLMVTRRRRGTFVMAAGVAVVLAPLLIRNVAVTGEWSALSSQGGLNFYIGNNPGANGTYRPVPGISANIEGQQFDARRVAEQAGGHALSDGDVSGYFFRRGLDWIAQNPSAAVALFARKLAYVFNAGPIFLNFSYPFFAYDTPTLLRALVVGPGLLVPLGLLGCALIARQRRPGSLVWLSFIPAYAIGIAAFFVSDRYQLPILIPCAVGAGIAVEELIVAVRLRRIQPAAAMAATLAFLAIVVNWPFALDDGRSEERARMAERLTMLGRYDEAEQWARRAEHGYPNPVVLHFRVGQRFLVARQPQYALAHLQQANRLDPAQAEVAYRYGQALLETGKAQASVTYLRQGIDAGLDVDLAGYDLARALAATGDRDAALAALQRVRPSKADPAQNDIVLGQFALQLQAPAVAERFFRRAIDADPQRASAHQQLGVVLGMIGRLDDGIRELQEAVRLAPADPTCRLNLAVVFAQSGRFSEARAEAETALRLDPRYDRARQLLSALPK
jgi:tetratricopeptide (TPR) repeat protein